MSSLAYYISTDNFIDEFGRSRLHYAANNGSYHLLRELLEEGVDINARDNNGWTALHFAASNNHFHVINLLLEYNADPNVQDNKGNGPLWIATFNTRGNPHGVLSLLKNRANPDQKNHYGRTPRYMAHALQTGLDEIFERYSSAA